MIKVSEPSVGITWTVNCRKCGCACVALSKGQSNWIRVQLDLVFPSKLGPKVFAEVSLYSLSKLSKLEAWTTSLSHTPSSLVSGPFCGLVKLLRNISHQLLRFSCSEICSSFSLDNCFCIFIKSEIQVLLVIGLFGAEVRFFAL